MHEAVRSVLEYATLGIAAIADLGLFCVTYLYAIGEPALAATANGILSWVQGSVFFVFGLYFLCTWLARRYPDRPSRKPARALKDTREMAQTAVLAPGNWDNLGVELGRICGPDPRKSTGWVKGATAWFVGLAGQLLGAIVLEKSLTAGVYAGDFLLALGVVFMYSIAQFWQLLHVRWQARHPENYSPCGFVPLLVLPGYLRKTRHTDDASAGSTPQ